VRLSQGLEDFRHPPHKLEGKDKAWKFPSLDELVAFILEEGQRGVSIQRFKGLGEMNPDQLWETTMDPENRTLLKVNVEDGVAADEIFTILMGDKVEPRREFIQNNVLELAQLDI
jgi:DNA gyrase subunit B